MIHLLTLKLIPWQVIATRFFDCLGLCLSHSSQFSGSMDKLIVSKPLSVGYLYSVAELKGGAYSKDTTDSSLQATYTPAVSKISVIHDNSFSNAILGTVEYELPHVPPWFVHAGSQKLYLVLAGIIRLVGLSTVSGTVQPSSQISDLGVFHLSHSMNCHFCAVIVAHHIYLLIDARERNCCIFISFC
jgi:hypothetical protein